MKANIIKALFIAAILFPMTVLADASNVKISKLCSRLADNNIVVTMQLNMDSLRMRSNQLMVYTPVISDSIGNSLPLQSVLITGRNEHYVYLREGNKNYPNAVEVRRKNGTVQTYAYKNAINYQPWMDNARLSVKVDTCGCGNIEGQGVVPGPPAVFRPKPFMAFVMPKVEATKVREEKGSAFIDFPVDKIVLYPEYRKNPRELAKIVETINKVKDDKNLSITHIDIHGYASPESPYTHNKWLAENRAKTLKDYVRNLMRMDDKLFSVSATPEDWVGLRKYVTESNLTNKAEILEIIDSSLEPDPKEWKMKSTYPDEYRTMLAAWYPALRHSDYTITYEVRPFTVEEAKEILKTKPQQLSLNEMFMVAQTYKPGSRDYNEVFYTAVRMFPDDETANLNAACSALQSGDLISAGAYLKKAGTSPEATHARGVLALLQKHYAEAETLLKQAQAAGVSQAGENLRILEELIQ